MTNHPHRRQDWAELATLTARARAWRGLSAAELWRFDYLYRRAVADLAQIEARTTDAALQQYLNQLVAAAHSVIYTPPARSWRRAGNFFGATLPRVLAAHWRAHLLALLIMLGGIGASYALIERDPLVAYTFLTGDAYGIEDPRAPGAERETLEAVLRAGRDDGNQEKAFFSALLFTNNLRVALLTLVSGLLVGVPTVLLIFYNGMLIGAFLHLYHSHGIYAETWAWFLPHAVPELGAVVLCGGFGLALARAIIAPGYRSRLASLRACGREVLSGALGVAILVLLAALIESFLRQSELSTGGRLTFAGGVFLLLAGYMAYGVRKNN
ncbi:hypothetical protein FACS1894139_07540 [Planctomycetales bacterium]|nr:hypothetical protein FACS1894107_14240 [Planctomycetales bacterium]GHT04804.1 hypothetical protein FACS1894139_07540 [Planctomycetales bacterium]